MSETITDIRILDGQRLSTFSHTLDQCQTEALLDLLVFSMYADGEAAVEEVNLLHKRASAVEWRAETPLLEYIQQAAMRLRPLAGSMAGRLAFLEEVRDRLGSADAVHRAYLFAEAMLRADNIVVPAEEVFARDVREVFRLTEEDGVDSLLADA